jgi:hypothetical protein
MSVKLHKEPDFVESQLCRLPFLLHRSPKRIEMHQFQLVKTTFAEGETVIWFKVMEANQSGIQF